MKLLVVSIIWFLAIAGEISTNDPPAGWIVDFTILLLLFAIARYIVIRWRRRERR